MTQPGHKICSYCQEEILATAIKCRFCQEWLVSQPKEPLEELIGNLVGKEIGNYKVVGHLGDGGMGSIWQAEHIGLHRDVAIKVLHGHLVSYKEVVKRFLAEARTLVHLGSPYLVEILDLGLLPDGRPYFVMEYLEGVSLDVWMEGRVVPLQEVFTIGDQLMHALCAVHVNNIVHRDLKPSNLMLTRDEEGALHIKLLDFGIAKFLERETNERHELARTLTGMTVGTPVYMSPEQAGGVRELDARSDVYSAGVLLYHVATGNPPFLSENLLQIMEMHRGSPPPSPRSLRPELPKAFEAWLFRCLAKHPKNRFQSAEEARVALEALQAIPAVKPSAKSLPLAVLAAAIALSLALWAFLPPGESAKAAEAPTAPTEASVSELSAPLEEPPALPVSMDEPSVGETMPINDVVVSPKIKTSSSKLKTSQKKSRPTGLPGPEGLFEPYKNR